VHSQKVTLVAPHGHYFAARLTGNDGMHVPDMALQGVLALGKRRGVHLLFFDSFDSFVSAPYVGEQVPGGPECSRAEVADMRSLLGVSVLVFLEILRGYEPPDGNAYVAPIGFLIFRGVHSQKVTLVAPHGQHFAARLTGNNGMHVLYVAFQCVLALEN